MRGNFHVRFGGGRLETQVKLCAGRLPYQVAVMTATSSVLTAVLLDITRCSASGILSERASSGNHPFGGAGGVRSLRDKSIPCPFGTATESQEDVATASTKRSGARIAWYG
jgi:hypothetical protein